MSTKPKKKASSISSKKVVVTGSYIEQAGSDTFDSLMKLTGYETRVKYWLGRFIDKLESESKVYVKSRQEILDEYAEKHTEAGTTVLTNGAEVQYEVGDNVLLNTGSIRFRPGTRDDARDKLDALADTEIPLDITVCKCKGADLPKDLSPADIRMLLPIIELEE